MYLRSSQPEISEAPPTKVEGERHRIHDERVRRTHTGRKRQRFMIWLVTAVTLGSGILNLLSVMGGPNHPHYWQEIFPLEFIRLSRTVIVLTGFALIVSSVNIYRRRRRAWLMVMALTSFSVVFHLTKGLDYQEATLSFALLLLLIASRSTFRVKSAAPDIRVAVLRLLVAAAVALGYGIAGFWFLDLRHFNVNFHIGDAVLTTLRLLTLSGDPRLTPHTHYAHWFLNSIYLIAVVAVAYAGFALFRPVVYRLSTLPRERARGQQIIERYGRTSLDYFKLWKDKSFFFSPTHNMFISYAVSRSVALALGDPVGPADEIEPTVREFAAFCEENGWACGFHQTLPDFLDIYRNIGFRKLKIGDDAIVDLPSFTLEGKARKEFRSKVRQLESMGIHIREYEPLLSDEVVGTLKEVSNEWLQIPGRRERTFTLGQFEREYVRYTPVLAACDEKGNLLAFVNLIQTGPVELTADLMRRRTEAPNGIMDYLFVKVFLWAKEHGYQYFNMGMAPMAGFDEREEATAEERAIHSFFQQLNFLFSFRGLRHYKAKFAGRWEPRYLIYRNPLDLPRLALALRRLSEVKDDTDVELQAI